MKKIALFAAFALFTNSLFSQQWNGNSNTTDDISREGDVSLGSGYYTINSSKLTVNGNFRVVSGKIMFGNKLAPMGNAGFFDIQQLGDNLYMRPANGNFPNLSDPPNLGDYAFVMNNPTGKIGMGTENVNCSTCNDYRLFVREGIKTEKIKVDIAASNGWADYVFKKDYKLMPLKEVEHFINNNGHLPEVPTTEEAIKNGIELKEMNILLLKKIEELTLYSIQQQKNIEEQNKRMEILEKKLNK
ncbi:hypothetical protein JI747_019505 [Chryseobacterium sp. RG1]|uniref:Cell wall anchor protein n=1 Tax=Chryseobacterium tagetis TaxID=2801334 RepID=A0ABS8A5V0_9FLAO|nr:hypothetical protein [Chryseobacterium tagetis]MCA6069359.1 hypothetical protein [Chryseobacterium tagetis]